MRVIDFIGTGAEHIIYVICAKESKKVLWRGTRKDFVWELTAFFSLYSLPVHEFDVGKETVIYLFV